MRASYSSVWFQARAGLFGIEKAGSGLCSFDDSGLLSELGL